jgi:hypothetical protein
MLRRVLRIVSGIAVIVLFAAVLVEGTGPVALRIGIVSLWVVVVLVAPWTAKKLGLPKQQADEAYVTSLRRWRRARS